MAEPRQPSPQQVAAMQQMQQAMAAEAAKRGMTPEDFAKQQREQLTADAAKQGMTPEQYVAQLRMRAISAAQQQQRQGSPQPGQQQGQAQGQPQPTQHQVPVNTGGPPDPKAIAVAKFLRSQDLKPRTCVLDGQRKDLFKGISYLLPSIHQTKRNLTNKSKTRNPRPRIPRIRQSMQKEPATPPYNRPRLRRKHLQTPPTLPPRTPRHKNRPARWAQPRQAQEPSQGTLDRQDRAAPRNRPHDALRLAIRGTAVESQGDGCRCGSWYLCSRAVPALADGYETGCLVSECWIDDSARTVLCYGDL